jgi:hypothetical protein
MFDYSKEILAPNELRGREFKRSEPWEVLKHKIAKTAMAMANKRDGGIVVIGVAKNGETHEAMGMEDAHFASYKDDEIAAFVNKYAEPFVITSVQRPVIDGRKFVVIRVEEFEHLPVVCAKAGEGDLREGAVYIRGYAQVETRLVACQTEMRELLDMAVERGIRSFLGRAAGAGLQTRLSPTDDEHFNVEQREFADRLSVSPRFAHGCFLFSIRPTSYAESRIELIDRLHRMVREAAVDRNGWSFPFTYRSEQVTEKRSVGSPAQPTGWGEFWRMYQSGHFLYAVAHRESAETTPSDILETLALRTMPSGFQPSGYTNIHTLYLLVTMAYVFASRLATAGVYAENLRISVLLTNTRDRVAVSTRAAAPLRRFWRATAPEIESVRIIDIERIVADPFAQAVPAIDDIMQRFAGDEFSSDGTKAMQDYVWNR